MSYRDSQTAIVHVDTDLVRATTGIGELFHRHTVELPACYAVPRAGSSRLPTEGPEHADVSMNGVGSPEDKNGWLVGGSLAKMQEESGWEEKWEIRWPFRPGQDWVGRGFVLLHLLSLLGINVSSNPSPLLLIPPPSPPALPPPIQALYTQLAFETLNVPALSILPLPTASLFALGATTGIILHVGTLSSEVFVVTDSVVRWECSTTIDIGSQHCQDWLERLLMDDQALDQALGMASGKGDEPWGQGEKDKLVKEVRAAVWKDCLDDIEIQTATGARAMIAGVTTEEDDDSFDVAKKLVGDPTGPPKPKKAKPTVQADSDAITITIPSLPGKELLLGPVRHRLCEPIFNGLRPGGDTVWEGMGRAVDGLALSQAERMAIWEGVGVVGSLARIKSFAPSLVTYLSPFLLSSADLPSDTQPAKARLLSIPDYFSNFKGATCDLAPFLGGSIVAKVAFSDAAGKHSITKVDYNARGPGAIYATGGESSV